MSEPDSDPDGRVFRAALPGWQAPLSRPGETTAALFAPGRGALEIAVLLAACTMLLPVLAPAAVGAAWRARRAGNSRGAAVVVLALWCGVLGLAARGALGLAVVP